MVRALVAFLRQNHFFFTLISVEDSRSGTGKGANRKRWNEERGRQLEAIEAVLRSGTQRSVSAQPRPSGTTPNSLAKACQTSGGTSVVAAS